MQLVLIDTSNVKYAKQRKERDTRLSFLVDKSFLCPGVWKRKRGDNDDLSNEDRVRRKLVSEIMEEMGDVGSLWVDLGIVTDKRAVRISVNPCFTEMSIFKNLTQKFQEKVNISVYLKQHRGREMVDFATVEGMKIHPEKFMCTGTTSTTTTLTAFEEPLPLFHVKLVADIDDSCFLKLIPSAQKILEKGSFSDVVISAGNGASIKAHKSFLSVSSPVLEAVFASGMQESETGRLDMSDISEKGVCAFLRYLYYADLTEPKENVEIAYELLYASHKYQVSTLETEMLDCLLKRKNEFSVELAFKTYSFRKNH